MIGAMARRMSSPVMVGRTEVALQLQAAVEASRQGEPRHIVVGGEAGVGKTRLLTEARAVAEAGAAMVLVGGCVSVGDEGLPFAPYTEVLRSLVAREGADRLASAAGRAAGDLARLVPALGSGEALPIGELWAQARLFEALLGLLRRCSAQEPLVLQLEDLHWADAGTLAATSFLLRAIEHEPITIMATFRTDEITRRHPLRPWLAEMSRLGAVERIDLEPLSEPQIALLVRTIIDEDLASDEIAAIQLRSDGNPFFIEELLASRIHGGEALPGGLRDVLLARIDTLPESAQHLLGIAAVGGRVVEHEALVEVAGEDGDAVRQDLRQLVDAGLLVPTRALDDDDAYGFRHALLQEAVYDAMLPTERRRLHRDWGETLASHDAAAAMGAAYRLQLAHHWREARDARALPASISAGDAAMEGFSYGIAAREYEEALLLWGDNEPVNGSDVDHVALLERSSRAAYMAAEYRRAVATCREAIAELGDADEARLTTLLILLGRTLWVAGDWTASIDAYAEALRIAPSEPPIMRARALAGLGQVHMLHGRLAEARPLCEEAVKLARSVGARDLEGHALNTLGLVLAALGEAEAGISSSEAALRIALELGLPDDIGRAHVNLAEAHFWAGYAERALASGLEGIRAAADWGVARGYGAYIGYGAVQSAFECGEWSEAARLLAEADRTGSPGDGALVYRATYALELLACLGDEEAASLWPRVREMVSSGPSSDNLGTIYLGGIERAAFAERYHEAVEITWEGFEVILLGESPLRYSELARVAAWPVAETGRSALAAGDAGAAKVAADRMAQLVGLARQWRAQIGSPDSRLGRVLELNALQVEAEQARMLGPSPLPAWRSVADGWSDIGRPFRSAMARWREAEAAAAAGERDVAAAALREAHGIAMKLGAKPLLGHLDVMARRLRVRLGGTSAVPTIAPDRAYGLTPREREVLNEVAAGRTNREIAANLFISESTAGVHVSNILGKLGVSTRTEAARVALDQGLSGD